MERRQPRGAGRDLIPWKLAGYAPGGHHCGEFPDSWLVRYRYHITVLEEHILLEVLARAHFLIIERIPGLPS